jgi:FMN reductase
MDQMRTAVRQCYGWSLPYGVSFHGDEDFDAAGNIRNERIAHRMRMLTRDLVAYGTLIRQQFLADLDDKEPDTFAARYRKK